MPTTSSPPSANPPPPTGTKAENYVNQRENRRIRDRGDMNLAAGIQVTQLALKHRQNKKQQQRITVFTARPR
ncbi:hypothetical protein PIB30_097886 [Stylosanthes scabra]|uniref:VWFA domain-containing protein n=1 Tax=Stylosanthes scabra TaxID=79078 RepID=A0ABU6WWB2_9FABA|nr:hypothetical protein [Stylosanthes scabra]